MRNECITSSRKSSKKARLLTSRKGSIAYLRAYAKCTLLMIAGPKTFVLFTTKRSPAADLLRGQSLVVARLRGGGREEWRGM